MPFSRSVVGIGGMWQCCGDAVAMLWGSWQGSWQGSVGPAERSHIHQHHSRIARRNHPPRWVTHSGHRPIRLRADGKEVRQMAIGVSEVVHGDVRDEGDVRVRIEHVPR